MKDLLVELKRIEDLLLGPVNPVVIHGAIDEIRRMRKREAEWMDCIERLASAGYGLMQLAGGADVVIGDMQFACKYGMFSEQIAGNRIKRLLLMASGVTVFDVDGSYKP